MRLWHCQKIRRMSAVSRHPEASWTPVWCSCRLCGRSACLTAWGQWRSPCGWLQEAGTVTPSLTARWGAPRTLWRIQPERRSHGCRGVKRTEGPWKKQKTRATVGAAAALQMNDRSSRSMEASRLRISPVELVLAEQPQQVRWWVVWKVIFSVHRFVHGGDILNRSLLLVLIMIHDVVDTAKTCPRKYKWA